MLEEEEARLRKQLETSQERLKKAKDKQRNEELADLKPLAIKAHDVLCTWNHIDGCGWHYEIDKQGNHSWEGKYSAHARWLANVEKWLEHKKFGSSLTPERLTEILDLIAKGKAIHQDFLYIVQHVIMS